MWKEVVVICLYFEVRYWNLCIERVKITKDFSHVDDSQAENRSGYVRDIIQNLCSSNVLEKSILSRPNVINIIDTCPSY
jgi:hypothetical protein